MKDTLEFLGSLRHLQKFAYFVLWAKLVIVLYCPFSEDDQFKNVFSYTLEQGLSKAHTYIHYSSIYQ